jgi:4-amino-4-deoxy-L-arabinose transferase-like glycosyltransferase
MLIFSIILYLALSFYICKWVYGELSIPKLGIIFFLVVFVFNVVIFQALAVYKSVNSQVFYLILQLLLCGVTLVVLVTVGKVNLRFPGDFQKPTLNAGDFAFITVIIIVMGGLFFIGMNTVPNNADSLATHLTRIYYWLQHGDLNRWTAVNKFQLTYPVNANFQGSWLFLLGGSENLFFLVQWYSLAVLVITVYEISRMLGFSRTSSLLSAGVVLSFPVALFQAYTFQGDVTVTALVMVSIAVGYAYLKMNRLPLLLAALLAFALAIGTKQTAFFVIPVFLLIGALWLVGAGMKKNHVRWIWLLVVFLLIFSAPKYLQNKSEFGSFLGGNGILDPTSLISAPGLEKAAYSAPRYLYNFISFDGVPAGLANWFFEQKATIFQGLDPLLGLKLESNKFMQPGFDPNEAFLYASNPPLGEDTAWLGPLAFLLLPLATLVGLTSKDAAVRNYARFALFLGVSYSFILLLQRPGWDPFQARYFILAVVPSVPLVAALVPKQPTAARIVTVLLALCILTLGVNTILFNNSKPILTKYNLRDALSAVNNLPELPGFIRKPVAYGIVVLRNNAPERESILSVTRDEQVYSSNHNVLADLHFIEAYLPEDAGVSIYKPGYLLEFGLFGKNVSRRLFPIRNITDYDPTTSLVSGVRLKPEERLGLRLVAENKYYQIFTSSGH